MALTAVQKVAVEQQKARDQRRLDRLALVAQQEKDAEREALANVRLTETELRTIVSQREHLPAITIPSTKYEPHYLFCFFFFFFFFCCYCLIFFFFA